MEIFPPATSISGYLQVFSLDQTLSMILSVAQAAIFDYIAHTYTAFFFVSDPHIVKYRGGTYSTLRIIDKVVV